MLRLTYACHPHPWWINFAWGQIDGFKKSCTYDSTNYITWGRAHISVIKHRRKIHIKIIDIVGSCDVSTIFVFTLLLLRTECSRTTTSTPLLFYSLLNLIKYIPSIVLDTYQLWNMILLAFCFICKYWCIFYVVHVWNWLGVFWVK